MSDNVRRLRQVAGDGASEVPRGGGILPEDCPVTPLGVQGNLCWFLDALGQLTELTPQQLGRRWLAHLFNPQVPYLEKHWPRYGKDGKTVVGIRSEAAADDMARACGALGVWSPYAKVRGRGAWRGADGDLVLHLGSRLWIRGRPERPSVRAGLVYPVLQERPAPAYEPQPGGEGGPAAELLAMLRTWSWARPDLDPMLLLGWICAAMLGGALTWRPGAWLTGDRGTGKSTLQELIKFLFVDGEGILSVANTTAAGIRQRVDYDSVPVALDELEPEAEGTRVQQVIELLRLASSGGTILRGGADHTGSDFIARFCFLASSILVPPMRPQDRSRIALLNLRPLDRSTRPPRLMPDELKQLGRRLLRRVADMWPQLDARLEIWRDALLRVGYDARGADQYGTLLACADVALHDDPPDSDSIDVLLADLVAGASTDRADEMPDWQQCLTHLTTTIAQSYKGGEMRSIGTLIAYAAGAPVIIDPDNGERIVAGKEDQDKSNEALSNYGLRVVREEDGHYLAVANSHTGLAEVYARTHWRPISGSTAGWRQALLRVPGARPARIPVRFRHGKQRAALVPIAWALGEVEA